MRKVEKVTGKLFEVFEREFKALGSPRTLLAKFSGVSKSYVNVWLRNNFLPLEEVKYCFLFLGFCKQEGKLPSGPPKHIGKNLFRISAEEDSKLIQLDFGKHEVNDECDYAIFIFESEYKIFTKLGEVSVVKIKLYELLAEILEKKGLSVDINRTHVNSFRFMFNDNDIESLVINVNDDEKYNLKLSKCN